jgi:hypothetical protein
MTLTRNSKRILPTLFIIGILCSCGGGSQTQTTESFPNSLLKLVNVSPKWSVATSGPSPANDPDVGLSGAVLREPGDLTEYFRSPQPPVGVIAYLIDHRPSDSSVWSGPGSANNDARIRYVAFAVDSLSGLPVAVPSNLTGVMYVYTAAPASNGGSSIRIDVAYGLAYVPG